MRKSGYIDVDGLQAETTLEAAAAKCGVTLDVKNSGKEARIDCPFGCPGDHCGRREVSISTDNPQKIFYCHAYQCQLRGNLLMLMHGWLTGDRHTGDKLKGTEFKRVRELLASKTSPDVSARPAHGRPAEPRAPVQDAKPSVPSIPLEANDDPNLRALATLDEKLITDVAQMHPAAASYVRRHPCLTPESMTKWRAGYLPLDGGSDKRGFSLRGHILYPMLSEDSKVLAWVGRDVSYEDKEREFQLLIPAEREKRKPPQKHKVPAGFARGSQLFGQQASRLKEPHYREFIARHGIVIVEGFNDVIAADTFGIPTVGLCSNRITESQAEKVTTWARQLAGGKVALLFDCDGPGDEGAKEALWLLAQRGLDVRPGWSRTMHGGAFAGRQPEGLSLVEWQEAILPALAR